MFPLIWKYFSQMIGNTFQTINFLFISMNFFEKKPKKSFTFVRYSFIMAL